MTHYEQMLHDAAAEKVAPLAATVQKLGADLAKIDERVKGAREDLAQADANIAQFKAGATEKLTSSTSAYKEWQGRLRRLMLEKDSQLEALALLDGEIRPNAARNLDAARKDLARAVWLAVSGVAKEAEKAMAGHLAACVDEKSSYMAAAKAMCETHHLPWIGETVSGAQLRPDPVVYRPLDNCYCTVYSLADRPLDRSTIHPALRPPLPSAPSAESANEPAQDARGDPHAAQDTPDAVPVAQDAPGAAPPTAPDAVPASDDVPVDALAAQAAIPAAQDAPGSTPTAALDPLPCPAMARPKTALTGSVLEPDG